MIDVVVMVSGGGTNLEAILEKIESGYIDNARVKMVISNNKNAYAIERAKNHGIEARCISPRDFESREEFNSYLVSELSEINPDLIVLAGYLVVIPEEMTERFKNRIINIHPSLIPAFCGKGYYGLKVHEGALERGVKLTGATVHFVDSGTDTGPIILQKAVSVADDDTPETLQKRVMVEAEWEILPEAIKLISEGRVKVVDGRVKINQEI